MPSWSAAKAAPGSLDKMEMLMLGMANAVAEFTHRSKAINGTLLAFKLATCLGEYRGRNATPAKVTRLGTSTG
jgi:hypothetical protein